MRVSPYELINVKSDNEVGALSFAFSVPCANRAHYHESQPV